jgi:lysophospholipase L1-like esterase
MRLTAIEVIVCSLLSAGLTAQAQSAAESHATPPGTWVGTWSSSQQIPEPPNTLPLDDLRDATVRQIFHVSIGGSILRVRLSNTFGAQPLHFTSVHLARPLTTTTPAAAPMIGPSIDPATDRALTFSGAADVVVPAGAEYFSDPIDYPVTPLSSIAVSFHLDNPPMGETSHPGSHATTFYVHGDKSGTAEIPDAKQIEHWYQVSGIDVEASAQTAAIVAFGDSITDGHGATTNGNDRWTDVLAARLQGSAATKNLSVLNVGTGGNRLLNDGLGPNALARFGRDVLAQSGVRYLIVFEGVNDLGTLMRDSPVPPAAHAALVARMEDAYQQMILRAHAHGIEVIGATITPLGGSAYAKLDPDAEADRQAVNAWIRAAGHFDAVVDFDQVVHDPQQPERLLAADDSGDHLHPSPAGYRAMAEAIPLEMFLQPPASGPVRPGRDVRGVRHSNGKAGAR